MTNDRELMAKIDGNPEGKGVNGLLDDWRATEPRGVVAKPPRQVLADLFASMLVLSAAFKHRPVTGSRNYLYWFDGEWSLSLIAPDEWSDPRRAAFVATCILQRDMTWKILPSDRLPGNEQAIDAIRHFYRGFVKMLDTDLTLEEILPFHVSSLSYYQRLYASALSRSVCTVLACGDQGSKSSREWAMQLPHLNNALLAYNG
jgi:hypothetical protein